MVFEYDTLDATAMADLVRRKELTATELARTAISVIESRNPALNAVIRPLFEQGLAEAAGTLPQGPFTGVPFLIKDLLAAYAGQPMSCGSRAFKDYIPATDSELVTRFRKAGLVILGKTNLPEFGLMGVTEPELWGPTRNPWNPDRTPGGSSGGSASAVAAGMVPLAGAGDGGGSIRIPASCCGLFGLKPTRGRNPIGPSIEPWQGAVVEHALSRSVRDSAGLLDATQGMDDGSRIRTPAPASSYLSCLGRDPGKLRIAFSTESPLGMEVDPACSEAVKSTAALLESLGHHVEEAKPDIDGQILADTYFTLYFGEAAADIRSASRHLGRKARRSDFELTTWLVGRLGKKVSAEAFVMATRYWERSARKMAAFHQNWDLYLTPTMAALPSRIGELKESPAEALMLKVILGLRLEAFMYAAGPIRDTFMKSLGRTPFTQLANLTGQPAMSVPLYWTPAEHPAGEMPVGSHFMAPFGREDVLFSLASQLEQARPWFDRRPSLTKS